MIRWGRRLLIALLSLAAWSVAVAQQGLGIAPVYDSSGNPWGPLFSQYLTLYLYEELHAASTPATLLNPGGVYSPADTSWLVDYVSDQPGVISLLITTLNPAVYADKSKNRVTLTATAFVMDRDGHTKEELKASAEVPSRDTDVGSSFLDPLASFKLGFTTGHRTFERSPLGKAARSLAEQIRARLQANAAQIESAATPVKSVGPCPMHVKVTYSYRRGAISQAYSLVVNGLDQSMSIDSGVASFKAPEGPLLIQMSVADAPYKLAAQEIYQFTPLHSCAKGTYVIDLGKSGDAHDRWE